MAYALDFSNGGTVSFTAKALRGSWAWELELVVPNSDNQRALNFNNNNFRYLRAQTGKWELRNGLAGLPNVTSTSNVVFGERTVIRVEADNDEVSWFINGTPEGYIGTQTSDFILNNLNNTGNFTGIVYRFDVWQNGVLVESRKKQNLTGADDRVFNDLVGNNDGYLDAAFPNNNAQWLYYDDGGGGEVEIHEFSASSVVQVNDLSAAQKLVSLQSENVIVNADSTSAFGTLRSLSYQGDVLVNTSSAKTKIVSANSDSNVTAHSTSLNQKQVDQTANCEVLIHANGTISKDNIEQHEFAGQASVTTEVEGSVERIRLFSGQCNVVTDSLATSLKVPFMTGICESAVEAGANTAKLGVLHGTSDVLVRTLGDLQSIHTFNGDASVLAEAGGAIYNTDTIVEPYTIIIDGKLKAPLDRIGVVKDPLRVVGLIK